MPADVIHQAVQVDPAVVCSGSLRQRDPAFFSGTDDPDAEDWLTSYERVSTYNKWDDATKLNNVIFYLTGIAQLWYQNHEADIPTWATFKSQLSTVFGRPAVRKLRAEQRLRERSQQQGESFTSYIEDVVNLCTRVNSQMSEADKIRHILKGIEEDAFHMLLSRDLRTVSEVVTLCQSYDELRKQRILTRQHAPLVESLASLSPTPDRSELLRQIKEFVREEVGRQLSLLPTTQDQSQYLAPALRHVITASVAEALPPTPRPPAPVPPPAPVAAPLTYAEAVARPRTPSFPSAYFPPPVPVPQISPAPTPPRGSQPQFRPQSGNPWRTTDNLPICYSCGLPGHIARHCRRRQPGPPLSQRASGYWPPQDRYSEPEQPPRTRPLSPDRSTRRSLSPRRRSISPMHRRTPLPPEEN